jgi:proline dehydrogenase
MSTIKIQHENLATAASKVTTKTNEYETKIVNASVSFLEIKESLIGKGYDSLLGQMSEKIEAQKRVVAECKILAEKIVSYNDAMSNSETNVVFPN